MSKDRSIGPNDRLRAARLQHGWSQQWVADQLETTIVTVNRWERGVQRPGAYFRLKLCALFKTSADELGFLPDVEGKDSIPTQEEKEIGCLEGSIRKSPVIAEYNALPHSETYKNLPHSSSENVFLELPNDQSLFSQSEVHSSTIMTRRQSEQRIATRKYSNRQQMLDKVRAFWIAGTLKHSLNELPVISLQLQIQPDAVINPWKLAVHAPGTLARHLYAGVCITEVYDEQGGELLILGEAGSGKTTLLLELTRDLLDRADQDENHPMPIIFHLSSWAEKQLPLNQWLIQELIDKYQVPRKIAQMWIALDHILPLLDGLDEVGLQHRALCVNAINTYRREHGLLPTVVCCRSVEYFIQTKRFLLHGAVTVLPLTVPQIEAYFSHMGEQIAALNLAFHHDLILQELATTPLMISVLILTYQGKSLEDLLMLRSLEEQRAQVFTAYVQRMLNHRAIHHTYTHKQTIHWVAFLAQQLVRHHQSIFYIEQMQPDWLPTIQMQRIYDLLAVRFPIICISILLCVFIGTAMFSGSDITVDLLNTIFYILIGSLIGGWFSGKNIPILPPDEQKHFRVHLRFIRYNAIHLMNGVIIGVLTSLLFEFIQSFFLFPYNHAHKFNLPFGISSGLTGMLISALHKNRNIEPAEVIDWSWHFIKRSLFKMAHLRNSLLVGGSITLLFILGSWQVVSKNIFMLSSTLLNGLGGGVFFWLLLGIFQGLSSRRLEDHHRIRSNQGIRNSIRNSLLTSLISLFMIWFFYTLIGTMTSLLVQGIQFPSPEGFYFLEMCFLIGSIIGLTGGIIVGLLTGGLACLRHLVVRLLLWHSGLVPWNYPDFLDHTAACLLLRKVGGGYIFIHRLLLEYFTNLNPSELAQVLPIFPHEYTVSGGNKINGDMVDVEENTL